MKTAIFTTPAHPPSIGLMEYFRENNHAIDAIILEQGMRKNLSSNERIFRESHDRFNRTFKKYPLYRRIGRKVWDSFPFRLKQFIWHNISRLPVLNQYSVEKYAQSHSIPVYKVNKHSSSLCKQILEQENIQYVLLSSSNWLIKDPLLSMKNTKIINAHPGYLPKHRGLDSISWSIVENDPIGYTTYFLDEGVDSGPVLKFYPIEVKNQDNLLDLFKAFEQIKPWVFYDTIKKLESGSVIPKNQPREPSPHRPMSYRELLQTDQYLRGNLTASPF